jgi:riboflavin kinase/FMN adenylyltransferase
MKQYESLEVFTPLAKAIVTTGTFDGVHIGHQKILTRLTELAEQQGGETVLITFFPHPRLVLKQNHDEFKLLSTLEEKAKLLESAGIQHFIVLPFTPAFAQLSAMEYATQVYQYIGSRFLVIGYDHRFGQARSGNIDFLRENSALLGFEVEEISRQDIEEVGVSSTKIRQALTEGNITLANQYLGYSYSLSGKVVLGDQIGRTLGYPTANLHITEDYKLIPAHGIYAIKILVNNTLLKGVLYIGTRPTLAGKVERRIEAHIFDFEGNIYDQEMTIQLIDKVRGDAQFPDLETLKAQMYQDELKARQILNA